MSATHFICTTCGVQFPAGAEPPAHCPICDDERQYVGWGGQQWTTLDQLRADHSNRITDEEEGLTSLHTEPKFGIGERAFLVRTGAGNVLWDCITLLDDATTAAVRERGGVDAIAISHPHYYSTMVEWSRAFGDAPVYIHEDDAHWVMRPDACVEFWSGETHPLAGGCTLVRTGGHFAGYQVLHWLAGAGGRGVLLSGDQPQVCADRRWVSFMYSYPNMIPLNAPAIRRIVDALRPFSFDRIYGAFPGLTVESGAKASVERSADRYLRAIAA